MNDIQVFLATYAQPLIWLVIALAVIFVATFAATYYNRRKNKHHGA